MSDADALQQAKDIAGKLRDLGGVLYTDEPEQMHMKLDAFLLTLLEKDYPELVKFVGKVKRWYG
jgi:hypothetical protein